MGLRIRRSVISDARGGVLIGIGDDAAVLRPAAGTKWAVSCDSSLEGVHFLEGVHPPESVGYKALARAASDLAAMGAVSRFFLLALALPNSKTGRWLDRFALGMAEAARKLEREPIRLIGGDLSRSEKVLISVTVIGVASGSVLTRVGARVGDLIFVSGRLGAAQLGLELVRRGLWKQARLSRFVQPHFYPEIPTRLGQLLASTPGITAMMDISDGLSTDLSRLCAASRVGARIWAERLPRIEVPASLTHRRFDSLKFALHGGDDYGLLFTVRPKSAPLLRAIARKTKARLAQIGEITRNRKVFLAKTDGRISPLPDKGWDPFRR